MILICGCAEKLEVEEGVRISIYSFKAAAGVFKVEKGWGEPGVISRASDYLGDEGSVFVKKG